jgi:dCTP diphosphatase
MGEIADLRRRLREFAEARDWEQFHSPKNLAMALIVEAAELVEHFQWMGEKDSLALEPLQQEEVAMEMADIFIYLLRLADRLDVDLGAAAWRKIQINEDRYPVESSRGKAGRPRD